MGCKCGNEAVEVFAMILTREFFLLWRALANFEGTGRGRMSSDQQSNCQKINSLISTFTGGRVLADRKTTIRLYRGFRAPRTARESARSFKGCPQCPGTHSKVGRSVRLSRRIW